MIDHEPLAVAEDLAIDAMFWRWAQTTRPGAASISLPAHLTLLRCSAVLASNSWLRRS